MWSHSRHLTSLIIGNSFDINFGKLDAGVEHLPLIPKISDEQPKISQLYGIHNHCFRILLRSYKFINTHYPPDIVDITKNDNIVLQAILLRYLSIQFINIDFIIETMTDLD